MSGYRPAPAAPEFSGTAPGPQASPTNVLAIIALVLAFLVPLGGIICGHIALAQIRRTGEQGRGLALAATILGYVFVGLFLLAFALVVVFQVILFASATGYSGTF